MLGLTGRVGSVRLGDKIKSNDAFRSVSAWLQRIMRSFMRAMDTAAALPPHAKQRKFHLPTAPTAKSSTEQPAAGNANGKSAANNSNEQPAAGAPKNVSSARAPVPAPVASPLEQPYLLPPPTTMGDVAARAQAAQDLEEDIAEASALEMAKNQKPDMWIVDEVNDSAEDQIMMYLSNARAYVQGNGKLTFDDLRPTPETQSVQERVEQFIECVKNNGNATQQIYLVMPPRCVMGPDRVTREIDYKQVFGDNVQILEPVDSKTYPVPYKDPVVTQVFE